MNDKTGQIDSAPADVSMDELLIDLGAKRESVIPMNASRAPIPPNPISGC